MVGSASPAHVTGAQCVLRRIRPVDHLPFPSISPPHRHSRGWGGAPAPSPRKLWRAGGRDAMSTETRTHPSRLFLETTSPPLIAALLSERFSSIQNDSFASSGRIVRADSKSRWSRCVAGLNRSGGLRAHNAQVTATLMQKVPALLQSIEKTKDAVVRIGALLIVKIDWTVPGHPVDGCSAGTLDHRPQLPSSPQEIVAALNLSDGSRRAPDGPALWEELPEPLRSRLEPARYQSTGTEPPPGSDGSFMPPSGPSL
jgi:hypothetical protein